MSTNNSETTKGLKNSSITRVRPFFRKLFDHDTSWLPTLLRIATNNQDYAAHLATLNCEIIDHYKFKREYKDKILGPIQLEECFEFLLPPSHSLLRWMIENPGKLTWPTENGEEIEYGNDTQTKRENLFNKHSKDRQFDAMQEALKLLDEKGPKESCKKWWAFEGFTEVDCFFETEDFILAIEGKREEKKPSQKTAWLPKRDQIIRNLEAVKEGAGSKPFAVLLMNKDGKDPVKDAHFTDSLPHYSQPEINELKKHYLGAVSWEQACKAVGIGLNDLPDTIYDI